MKLASILNPELILCDVPPGSREEVYSYMLAQVKNILDINLDGNELLKSIIDREDLTHIPYEGMAIPHMRIPGLNDLFIAIGILKEPALLKDYDLRPTRVVVMSLISGNTSDLYLKALASCVNYFGKPENLAKLEGINSAEAMLELLEKDNVKVKKEITAEDVMYTDYPVVTPDMKLSEALNIMTRESKSELAVVDSSGKLLGVLSAREIIRRCIPEYIMIMDNLKFLTSFEPFQKIFDEEEHSMVEDYITEPDAMIPPETPLIHLTISLVKQEAKTIFVVNAEKHLKGVISIANIVHKVLRG
jgi:mannitol/fructose-specific phosphotransferase system IIA component (Ntr-type)/CBS domain-containing protein